MCYLSLISINAFPLLLKIRNIKRIPIRKHLLKTIAKHNSIIHNSVIYMLLMTYQMLCSFFSDHSKRCKLLFFE